MFSIVEGGISGDLFSCWSGYFDLGTLQSAATILLPEFAIGSETDLSVATVPYQLELRETRTQDGLKSKDSIPCLNCESSSPICLGLLEHTFTLLIDT